MSESYEMYCSRPKCRAPIQIGNAKTFVDGRINYGIRTCEEQFKCPRCGNFGYPVANSKNIDPIISVYDQELFNIITHLMDSRCKDIIILTFVDRILRRNWSDIHRGWVRWACYMEQLLGSTKIYEKWASDNCK